MAAYLFVARSRGVPAAQFPDERCCSALSAVTTLHHQGVDTLGYSFYKVRSGIADGFLTRHAESNEVSKTMDGKPTQSWEWMEEWWIVQFDYCLTVVD